MSEELDHLVAEYKTREKDLNDREKAVLEQRIWEVYRLDDAYVPEQADSAGNRRHQRDLLLKQLLGLNSGTSHDRQALLNGGHVAEPYWERILTGKMLTSTANKLFIEAKSAVARLGVSIEEATEAVFISYESKPFASWLNGVVIRKGPPSITVESAITSIRGNVRPIKTATQATQATQPAPERPRTRTVDPFWDKLRKDFVSYLDKELPDLDEAMRELIISDLMTGMKVLVDEARTRVRSEKGLRKDMDRAHAAVARRSVVEACKVLHSDAPEPGRPVNLHVVQKIYHRLARAYHPDGLGGDDSMIPKYDAVTAAWATVKAYNASLKTERRTENGGQNA